MQKTCLAALAVCCVLGAPAQAHDLKSNRKVGALMHIQPDDNPRAGAASVTWISLVRRGGTPIHLSECDCHLTVYRGKRSIGKALILPTLREGKVEGEVGNSDRLLANITFPKVGPYTLLLTGKPRNGGQFEPFQFEWTVRATG